MGINNVALARHPKPWATAQLSVLAALQDHGRSLVVGERTLVKGTMQRVRPWGNGSRIMKFCAAGLMFSPSGRSMYMRVIKPDLNAYDESDGKSAERVVPGRRTSSPWRCRP